MKPNSPSLEGAAPASGPGLTRREVLTTLALGLGVAGVAAGVAAAIALVTSKHEAAAGAASKPDRPRQLVEFNLVERSGRPVGLAELAGKYLVVDFVFTGCSLSCRAVNDRMEEIQRLVARASDVRLVSLTVDPRGDTPAVLARFAEGYHADANRWLFLTGDKAELYRLIETSFIAKSPEMEGLIPGGFASTDRIMLVDPEGNVFASFDGLSRYAAANVTAEIEKHRKAHFKK